MASYIKRGESVFFQFRDGKSVLSSQLKPRMFKTAEKATLGVNYVDTDDIVEYVEQKHGRWETIPGTKTRQTCSVCGMTGMEHIKFYSYCPNCGARMDGGNDNG